MCANYLPSPRDRIAADFGIDPRDYVFKPEVYPGGMAPMIRLAPPYVHSTATGRQALAGGMEVVSAMFGMVPHWADEKLARHTYNSRSETTATKPAFREAWKRRQFCIIPALAIFEPSYETGAPVRWKIGARNGQSLGIAGIWESRANGPGNAPLLSFSMLTVNADSDPLMRRFHKPDDEKRSVVILPADQYEFWLNSSLDDAPDFLQRYPDTLLEAVAAPRQRRLVGGSADATGDAAAQSGARPRTRKKALADMPEDNPNGDLFSDR